MRIAVSLLNYRPGKIGGTETYLRQLLAWLPELKGSDELIVVMNRQVAALLPAGAWGRVVVDATERQLLIARVGEAFTPYRARFAEHALAQARCDVVLFPQQSLFPKRVAWPCLVVAHAVQHVLQPRQYSWADRAFRSAAYDYAYRRAERIVAISQDMKATLVAQCRVPAAKVVVIPHGSLELNPAHVQPSTRVAGRFFFYPAATYPYKGHRTLLQTFAALRSDGYDGRLVLAGQQTPYWKVLGRDIRRLGLQSAVIHLGLLPFHEVLELYQAAEAVLLPTTYEGFGLPVMEAVAMRKKLITSRLPIFDEWGVPPQYQIDFADHRQLAAALALPGPTCLAKPVWTWRQSMGALWDELRRLAANNGGASRVAG
jgi:alpha-1,3-rhamnosyl/mannosyltransferase